MTDIDFVICSKNSHFDNDIEIKCGACKKRVYVRPTTKKLIKENKATPLCVECLYKKGDD